MTIEELILLLGEFNGDLEVMIAGEGQPASSPEYDEKTSTVLI